jgi:two-component system, OmpR family, sensor kinase
MIKSLRGRLFIGVTAIIILTGAIGGMLVYNWAFDEARELQDSVLIQLASLAQNGSFSGGQPLHGVEEDTEVWLIELGKTPRGLPDDHQLFSLQDGLQIATRKGSRSACCCERDRTAAGSPWRNRLPSAMRPRATWPFARCCRSPP